MCPAVLKRYCKLPEAVSLNGILISKIYKKFLSERYKIQ